MNSALSLPSVAMHSPAHSIPVRIAALAVLAACGGESPIQASPDQVATPTFNPAPGTYSPPLQVTLSDSTAGATIYYSTDESSPSTLYTGSITISIATTTSCSTPSASRLRRTYPPGSRYSTATWFFSTRVTGKSRAARWGGRSLARDGLTRLVWSTVPPLRPIVRVLSRSSGRT